ncbi:MAG: heparinase II/III domain-containing protein [Candidatus Rokuibacteriota bacterium]
MPAYRAAREASPRPVKVVLEPVAGKCRALNRAIDEAHGRFLAFLDDDVMVHEDYLIGIEEAITTTPYRVFGGRVLALWASPPPRWATGAEPLVTSRGPIVVHDYGNRPRVYECAMRRPVGCNFLCRRELFEDYGRFDIRLGPGSGKGHMGGEESELLRRFQNRGEAIFYAPRVAVDHPVDPHRVTKAYFRYRMFCAGRSAPYVARQPYRLLFGVPRHLYRKLATAMISSVRASVKGLPIAAFDHQLRACVYLGAMYQYRQLSRAMRNGRGFEHLGRAAMTSVSRLMTAPVRHWARALMRRLPRVRRGLESSANPTVSEDTKAFPAYPEEHRAPAATLAAANALLGSALVVGEGVTLELRSLSWRPCPFPDRSSSARLLFHALYQTEMLLQAYVLEPRSEYLDRAETLAARWIAENLADVRARHIWDDHTTALRAITLCRLWILCRSRDTGVRPLAGDLVGALVRHGNVLARRHFYRPHHNHGVVQAYALFALGCVLSDTRAGMRWRVLGWDRLEAQMKDNVSVEGLHREHSPAYHFFVLRHFLDARDLKRASGEQPSRAFEDRLRAMLSSAAHLFKPDGALAAVGDTCRASTVPLEKEELEQFPCAATEPLLRARGVSQRPSPPLVSTLAHGAGYAFLRSGPMAGHAPADERYVVVRTATFETAHIHRDVLSFELYGYGGDLVVDPGGPYRYGTAVRRDLMRTAAHNTVVVDDLDQRIGPATIHRWQPGALLDVVDASHTLYPGVVHRRLLALIRPGYLLVLDRLESSQRHRYTQVFHLHPALETAAQGAAVTTTRHDTEGPTLQLVPLPHDGLSPRIERGATGAHRGWVCPGDGQLVPAPVIWYEREGRSVTFAALVVPQRPGRPEAVVATLTGSPLAERATITVILGGTRDDIVVPPSGAVTLQRRPA